MSQAMNPAASHHLPVFVAGPDGNDVLMTVMAVFLVVAVLAVGILFLRLHTLPERIAHRGHKLQFEIVAVLGLLALFTHMHIFWVAGLLLALIDLPDFGVFNRMAGSLEKIARIPPGQRREDEVDDESVAAATPMEGAPEIPPTIAPSRIIKERVHA